MNFLDNKIVQSVCRESSDGEETELEKLVPIEWNSV